jgi:hypothetical protein
VAGGRRPHSEEIGNHTGVALTMLNREQAAAMEMQMPNAMNQDVRIHYRIEGDGEPLVLQHGFTDSLET